MSFYYYYYYLLFDNKPHKNKSLHVKCILRKRMGEYSKKHIHTKRVKAY